MPTQIDKDEITKLNRAQPEQKHVFKKIFNRVLTAIIVIILILVSFLLFQIISTSGQVFVGSQDSSCNNWFCNFANNFTQIPQIFGRDVSLKGQSNDRTNVMLLGVDASGENGLTDTIIIASLYFQEQKIVTTNIPRDTLVEYKGNRFKINELYQLAESNKKGSGATELGSFLTKELGIDIHYWALTNFAGTEKLVDLVGGIDVNVENAFTDCEFPNRSYGYLPCQTFQKGPQTMNGTDALIYARSRHGNNNEGNDFARSKRQSIVVQNILQKIKTQSGFQSVAKFAELTNILGKNLKTSLTPAELKSLVNFGKSIDLKTNFLRASWAVGNGFLCDTTDATLGYYIYYCPDNGKENDTNLNFNGQVMGTRPLIGTKAKSNAQKSVQNLLATAQADKVADTEIIILGNGAKSAQKIYNLLLDNSSIPSFVKTTINNYFTRIPVTATPEKITVYILDPLLTKPIKDKLDDSSANIQYTIKNSLDDKVILPMVNQGAKVIFWLE
jgi:LCP family protein required for cell wall assembly